MNVDYIIVGLGLAGVAFAEKLIEHNKTFVVFEDASQQSSLVAGGTYNPVILKRFTPVWNGHEQLQFAMPFYKQLEKKFNEQFDTKLKTFKIFNSVGDENNWFVASDKPMLSNYMQPKIRRKKMKGVICDFGYGELTGTGWIDTQKLLLTYKNYLKKEKRIVEERFCYADLKINKELKYQQITAKKIVFCEGFGVKENPFFNYLPLNGTKGETIVIYAPDLQVDFQLKATVFVFPLGDNLYKVGATFNWTDKTSVPTKEGRDELVKKLQKVITVPFKVVEQSAGIRPTVKDRRPLVGVHPIYKNMSILNGLGTRGVMIAPITAHQLFNHLEKNIPLEKETDISRFNANLT